MLLLQRVTNVLSKAGAAVAMGILVLMVVHILLEIVLRLFGRSTFVVAELVGYGVAAMTYLALASAFQANALIRVNLLLARLKPDSTPRRLVELACAAGTMAVISLAVWFFWLTVASNYRRGFTSGTLAQVPMWIPEGILLLGLAIFWLRLLTYMFEVALGRVDLGKSDQSGV